MTVTEGCITLMKNRIVVFCLHIAVVFSCFGARKPVDAQAWADSVMNTLSEREMIGQLFVPRLDITDNAAGFAQLKNLVTNHGIGGLLLGKGTCSSYAALINYGQSQAKIPLMITLDGEWGPAMRVTDAPRFPYNMALGAMRDTRLAYDFGREVARECAALGIQVDFAPVLDVNSNPGNPVIGQRSFGENPYRVAQLGALFCQGLEDGGVMAVGKHFPGHGDTSVDSHKALPTVAHSRAVLDSLDLLPFRESIRMGMSGIMVGHLKVPALDAKGTPASLSKKITTDLLKNELGFGGLIFTDALAMKGAVKGSGENNCVSAFRAGADIMLSSAAPVADMESMYRALKSGKISQKDLKERCRRVLIAKFNLGLNHRPVPADVADVRSVVNSAGAFDLIDRISRAAITAVSDPSEILPIKNLGEKRIAVVSIGENARNDFSDLCAQYTSVTRYGVTDGNISSAALKNILECDVVVVGVFSYKPWAVNLYQRLSQSGKTVGVFFLNPYKMSGFGIDVDKQTVIAAYGEQPSLQRAAAQGVFGGMEISGRLPVNVPRVAAEGTGVDIRKIRLGYTSLAEENMNSDLAAKIDSIVNQCIEQRAFPGCQIAVVKDGNFVINKSYGHLTYQADSPVVTDSTLYDVASMTKPLATVAALMNLYDEGKFQLTDSIGKFLPQLSGSGKGSFTVLSLLNHTTGLGGIDLFRLLFGEKWSKSTVKQVISGKINLRDEFAPATDRHKSINGITKTDYSGDAFRDSVISDIIKFKIKKRGNYRYSDLNFFLLRNMVESLSGVTLDNVSRKFYDDLGAWRTDFQPLNRFSARNIAPTEYDSLYRRSLVHGSVHDELAAFSGGVEGNAGLFSTATDVAKICQVWLNQGVYGDKRYYTSSTVKLFTGKKSKDGRTPGFDTASRNKSLCDMPVNIYGHTGFTGTSFWIAPDQKLIYVFLSNKIYPVRDNKAFNDLNPRVAILREIYKAL
ncbi:MAG: serine hydrolase [Paramuribaculum sp.]|nr:serine hydrolase [Paramuribaculum sp.]